MSRSSIEISSFFSNMEQYGFFDTVEEHLPDEFTIIYEIARILEDKTHAIARALAPILELNDPSATDNNLDQILIPNVPEAKEYEADLIRSVTEVRYIYPAQHLLPEMVFLRRLAERSLWMPRARSPRNFRYQTESDRFAPDDRKQKVYILFDTSSSMRQHYRIHLAKAIVYLFLQQNQRELGTIFFRTFDLTVGELRTARDVPSYDRLISDVMHINAIGNGTVLQKALQTAIDDISHESQLSQSQILVVTDGVAHIDLERLKEQMGDHITVNTVKIGNARMHVDAKVIEDQVFQSSNDDAVRLRELMKQKRDIELQSSTASGHLRQEALRSQLGLLQRQIDNLTERLGAFVSEHYGLEIQNLSAVYVNVDDIAPEEMFSLPEDKVAELEDLAESLLEALREEHQVEDIKRAAVLYDHLILLMKYNKIDASRFEKAAKELERTLDAILNKPTGSTEDLSISDLERMQLRNMLDVGSFKQKLSLAVLIRLLFLKLKRWWLARKQHRAFRTITGRTIRRR
ncbi:MAG: VWA domain-containing protein [Candidatus Kapabacteria bacterium]|nr:VWA domain-containing protein [Ignavibacteria bacterium]MBK6761302.1 VWA domain-containing protein [Ignavibacteria bacterium]MBK7412474.1 VWA domain-containing protein [Ignavibacteria bacterium]MBP6510900.1 VWA domain-containing protein [Candidatus Kapabacteria bacterium]